MSLLKDVVAVIVLPASRDELRRTFWIPEHCSHGDTDILNIHFAVMDLLNDDAELSPVFKNTLTIELQLKVLNSTTGGWIDFPLESRVSIPEKTCIKVILTSPDPIGPIRSLPPRSGVGRDPRKKPAIDLNLLNKRDPRRKNLATPSELSQVPAPVPAPVLAPAPAQVSRTGPGQIPSRIQMPAPVPAPVPAPSNFPSQLVAQKRTPYPSTLQSQSTQEQTRMLNKRDPRKRNLPAANPVLPALSQPLKASTPGPLTAPPADSQSVHQVVELKTTSRKDPRLRRQQPAPPTVNSEKSQTDKSNDDDQLMDIIRNRSKLSVLSKAADQKVQLDELDTDLPDDNDSSSVIPPQVPDQEIPDDLYAIPLPSNPILPFIDEPVKRDDVLQSNIPDAVPPPPSSPPAPPPPSEDTPPVPPDLGSASLPPEDESDDDSDSEGELQIDMSLQEAKRRASGEEQKTLNAEVSSPAHSDSICAEDLLEEMYGGFQKDGSDGSVAEDTSAVSSPTSTKAMNQSEGDDTPEILSPAVSHNYLYESEDENDNSKKERNLKTTEQLEKEQEMLANLEKERDRLNAIVENCDDEDQPPEKELEEGELSDSEEEIEDDEVQVCEDESPESPEMCENENGDNPEEIPLERTETDGEASDSDEIEIVHERPKEFRKYWEDFDEETAGINWEKGNPMFKRRAELTPPKKPDSRNAEFPNTPPPPMINPAVEAASKLLQAVSHTDSSTSSTQPSQKAVKNLAFSKLSSMAANFDGIKKKDTSNKNTCVDSNEQNNEESDKEFEEKSKFQDKAIEPIPTKQSLEELSSKESTNLNIPSSPENKNKVEVNLTESPNTQNRINVLANTRKKTAFESLKNVLSQKSETTQPKRPRLETEPNQVPVYDQLAAPPKNYEGPQLALPQTSSQEVAKGVFPLKRPSLLGAPPSLLGPSPSLKGSSSLLGATAPLGAPQNLPKQSMWGQIPEARPEPEKLGLIDSTPAFQTNMKTAAQERIQEQMKFQMKGTGRGGLFPSIKSKRILPSKTNVFSSQGSDELPASEKNIPSLMELDVSPRKKVEELGGSTLFSEVGSFMGRNMPKDKLGGIQQISRPSIDDTSKTLENKLQQNRALVMKVIKQRQAEELKNRNSEEKGMSFSLQNRNNFTPRSSASPAGARDPLNKTRESHDRTSESPIKKLEANVSKGSSESRSSRDRRSRSPRGDRDRRSPRSGRSPRKEKSEDSRSSSRRYSGDRKSSKSHRRRSRSPYKKRRRDRSRSSSRDRSRTERQRDDRKTDRRDDRKERQRQKSGESGRSAPKDDRDNIMLHFYEGHDLDFEDPGDPDNMILDPEPNNKEGNKTLNDTEKNSSSDKLTDLKLTSTERKEDDTKTANSRKVAETQVAKSVDKKIENEKVVTQAPAVNKRRGVFNFIQNMKETYQFDDLKACQESSASSSEETSSTLEVEEDLTNLKRDPIFDKFKLDDKELMTRNSDKDFLHSCNVNPVAIFNELCTEKFKEAPQFKSVQDMQNKKWSTTIMLQGVCVKCPIYSIKKKKSKIEACRYFLKNIGLNIRIS